MSLIFILQAKDDIHLQDMLVAMMIAGKVLLWSPDAKEKSWPPNVTQKSIIATETSLTGALFITVMADQELWASEDVHVSPVPSGIE